jgi:hypothetical protein
MEGMIIDEMAKNLGLPYKTVAQRILCGGYEPIFSGNRACSKTRLVLEQSIFSRSP